MTTKKTEQLEALASIADYITKNTIKKEHVEEISKRLDKVLANIDDSNKFFKRLL